MAEETAPAPVASSKSKKTLIVIAGILAVEAVIIIGVMKFLGGSPAKVSAVEISPTPESAEDKLVETRVLDAKMPNNKSGVTYIYATEVYVQVKQKHLEKVKGEIEQFQNEIKADITAIWRTAEPQHFQEPRLENLTRKVYALMNERFGLDKSDVNENDEPQPIVSKVVIVMSTGFRVDS